MLLLKHGFQYLLGRGVPGLIQLLALAVFSRLLSPDAYGQYSLVIAAVGLVNAVAFQWLRLGLLRFWPAHEHQQEVLISTLFAGFVGILACSCVAGLAGLALISDPVLRMLIAFGVALFWAEAMFEISQQLERSQLMPLRYGMLGLVKSVVSLAAGTALVFLGYGTAGLLAGTMAGLVVPLFWEIPRYAPAIRLHHVDRGLLKKMMRYGLPLTATFALGFFIKTSDRILLGWFLGAEDVGLYAVGANLAQHSIAMLMMIVNLAAYPLAVDALEKNGRKAADGQLRQNIILLFAIALPATTGICVLAPNIANVLLGESFRDAAVVVIPVITVGAFLAGIKAYYFDLGFQLGERTVGQLWVSLAAALVNVVLNLMAIPLFGLLGAAYSAVATYAVALVLSWYWGRRTYAVPVPVRSLGKIALATVCMLLILLPIRSYRGVGALAAQILIGAAVFILSAWGLGIMKSFRESAPAEKLSCQHA